MRWRKMLRTLKLTSAWAEAWMVESCDNPVTPVAHCLRVPASVGLARWPYIC